jgi:hypothetical protein
VPKVKIVLSNRERQLLDQLIVNSGSMAILLRFLAEVLDHDAYADELTSICRRVTQHQNLSESLQSLRERMATYDG